MMRIVSRSVRGVRRVHAMARSRLRIALIRLSYPSVRFDGRCFVDSGFRVAALGDATITISGCHLARNVTIEAGPGATIELAADYIGAGSFVIAVSAISIGKGSQIGEMAVVRDADHDHSRPLAEMSFISERIRIGDDVWVGSGARILKGVIIGDGASVGAGAVVTSSVDAGDVVGGVPARSLRRA
jgi:acetyltransferase-like isoleucine patch superfamily enzyme